MKPSTSGRRLLAALPATASAASHETEYLPHLSFCIYNNQVAVTYDPMKREITLKAGCLDFKDAEQVFDGICFEVEDTRNDYGEVRMICFGMLRDRMVVVGYTPHGADRHVFSMRKANEREQTRVASRLGI